MKRAVEASGDWFRIMFILMYEYFPGRYAVSKLGSVFAIFEPFAFIGLVALVHSTTATAPPFGTSNTLFYASGILPFYLFFHVSLRTRALERLLTVPRSTLFDVLLANIIDELLTKIYIMTLCFTTLWFYGVPDAVPNDLAGCGLALLGLILLGFSIGVFNAVVGSFFHGWHFLFAVISRTMMALSGIMTVMDTIPIQIRFLATYNPLAHAVTWFRVFFYVNYPHATLDVPYFLFASLAILTFSLLAYNYTVEWRH